jgi:hypothetical protein
MTHPLSARLRAAGAGLLAAMLLGACATVDTLPAAEIAAAQAAISQAENVGAKNAAPVELLAAREKLEKADAAVREERFGDARRLAEAAEADAMLADRKSRAAKAQSAAQELVRSNELLRIEAGRNAPR